MAIKDFHLHSNNKKIFNLFLSKKIEEKEDNNKEEYAIVNHYHIQKPSELMEKNAKEKGIYITPAYMFDTKEGFEFHVHNPQPAQDEILHHYSKEQSDFILSLQQLLKMDSGILIKMGSLFRKTGKIYPYEITTKDIAKEIMDPKYYNDIDYENATYVENNYIIPLIHKICFKRLSVYEAVDLIKNNTSQLVLHLNDKIMDIPNKDKILRHMLNEKIKLGVLITDNYVENPLIIQWIKSILPPHLVEYYRGSGNQLENVV